MARNAGATREEVEAILGKYRQSGLTRQAYLRAGSQIVRLLQNLNLPPDDRRTGDKITQPFCERLFKAAKALTLAPRSTRWTTGKSRTSLSLVAATVAGSNGYCRFEASYRARFNDAPAICFITMGGVVDAGGKSEDEAWELSRKAAESGKMLDFYKAPGQA